MDARTAPRGGIARRLGSRVVVASIVASSVTLARGARATEADTAVFEAAENQFNAGHYDQAHVLFERMLDPKNPPCATAPPATPCRVEDERVQDARAHDAAALVALGRLDDAEPLFEEILLANPNWPPDTALFPAPAMERFRNVKKRLQPRLDEITKNRLDAEQKEALAKQKNEAEYKRWIELLEETAQKERIVNSRVIALLPLGIGHWQNEERSLGLFFLGAEILAGGVSIGTGIAANYYNAINQYQPQGTDARGKPLTCNNACKAQLATDKSEALGWNRGTFAAWAGLTVVDIAWAQITFRNDRVIQHRPPLRPTVMPHFSGVPKGGVLGFRGTF